MAMDVQQATFESKKTLALQSIAKSLSEIADHLAAIRASAHRAASRS